MSARALLISSSLAMLGVSAFILLRQPVGLGGLQSLRYQFLLKVAAPCDYGQQAYQFNQQSATGGSGNSGQWSFQARDERCKLQPLVSKLLAGSGQGDWSERQLRILFNGDSIDRKLIEEFCRQARGELVAIPSDGSDGKWSHATLCNTTAVFMLHVWITGVHDDPPRSRADASRSWNQALSDASSKGLRAALGAASPEDSLREGARMLSELAGPAPPDLVVLSSALWDVTNWLVTEQLPRRDAPLFLGELGVKYEAALRAHVSRIRGLFPALPVLAMHTSLPFPYSRHIRAATADLGKNYHPYEGAYLSQVNSIQRHVAQDLGIPLIDYETILQQIPDKAAYEDDGRHVQPDILVSTMLEVILNAHSASSHSSRGFVAPTRWASARQSGGPPVSRPALPSMQHLTGDTAQHSVGPPA